MKKVTGKRFIAFIIDTFIVLLVSSLLTNIEPLNPQYEKYEKVYEEYIELYEEYTDDMLKGNEVDKKLEDKINDLSYTLSKNSVLTKIYSIVCMILYFVVFQYFNKGQTVGKALLKIKVVGEENKRPTFYQILMRSFIINSIFTSAAVVIILMICSKTAYLNIVPIIQYLDMALVYGSLGFMLFRVDGKGIHDILAKTYVKRLDGKNEVETEISQDKEESKVAKRKSDSNTKTKKTSKTRTIKVKEIK